MPGRKRTYRTNKDSKNLFNMRLLKCSTINSCYGWCGRRKRTKKRLGPEARTLLNPSTQRQNCYSIRLIIYWRESQSKVFHPFLSSTGGCTIRQEILSEWVNTGLSCKVSKEGLLAVPPRLRYVFRTWTPTAKSTHSDKILTEMVQQ